MKKIIFTFVIVAISLPSIISAQTRFGIKVGAQASAIREIHSQSEKRLPGINAGIFARIPLQKGPYSAYGPFFINWELNYSQEGEKDKKYNFYQDFINMPVLLRYHVNNLHALFFEAGPQLGLMINESAGSIDEKNYGKNKEYNVSVSAGAGVCFGSKSQFEIGARFNYGLIDMYSEYPKTNNHVNAALTVAYIFGGKNKKHRGKDAWYKTAEPIRIIDDDIHEEDDMTENNDDSEIYIYDSNKEVKEIPDEKVEETEYIVKPEVIAKNEVMIGSIFFGECKTKITSRHFLTIKNVAIYMEDNPISTLRIVGYADKETGNATNNMKFSERRAKAARDYIVENYNISPDRITVEWEGDREQPLVKTDNRCVLFFVK